LATEDSFKLAQQLGKIDAEGVPQNVVIHCSRRTFGSRLDILDLGLAEGLLAEILAQRVGSIEVYLAAAQNPGELLLHIVELEKADLGPSLELDQNIDVALGIEIGAQDGTEKGQPADPVPLAKTPDFVL